MFKMQSCPNIIYCMYLCLRLIAFVFWEHKVPCSGLFPLYHTCQFESIFHGPTQSLPKQFDLGMSKRCEHATVSAWFTTHSLWVCSAHLVSTHGTRAEKVMIYGKQLWAVGQILGKGEENFSWQDTCSGRSLPTSTKEQFRKSAELHANDILLSSQTPANTHTCQEAKAASASKDSPIPPSPCC